MSKRFDYITRISGRSDQRLVEIKQRKKEDHMKVNDIEELTKRIELEANANVRTSDRNSPRVQHCSGAGHMKSHSIH